MGIFKNLFGGKNQPQRKPSANSVLKAITFDRPASRIALDEPYELCYLSTENVAYLLRLNSAPDWNFDLRTLDGAKDFYGNQCAEAKGAMILLELGKADGAEMLRGIFKYRSPKNPLAIMYVGIIWIPFMECCLQINIEAAEQGTTGVREAIVCATMMADGTLQQEESFAPPVQVNSAEDMFKHMGAQPLRVISSDEEKWDEKFPEHPLSLVRKHLKTVTETIKLEKSMHELTPFRV
ncbi:MAG: hypothetical protein U0103_16490 [Candidatus Obscuribacterales bacterium]